MHIAQITSTYLSVPFSRHGGTEIMVYRLIEGLVERGHSVELFASGDSVVSAKLNSVVDVATSYDDECTTYIDKEMEARNSHNLYRQGDNFDVIHGHWPTQAAYFSSFTSTPTVLTYAYIERAVHEYYRANFPNLFPVCISRKQAENLGDPDLPVVPNGVDLKTVPFGAEPDDFLVVVGRISPNKGISDAIRIAKAAGERLIIIGHAPPQLPWAARYYEEEVKPHVDDDQVRHIEHLPNRQVLELVARAKGFLFPLQWEEPFGLAVAEAMAAGTPIVTYPKGAMAEIVAHELTGFIVESEPAAVRAIGRLGQIDRADCRAWVKRQFPIERMVQSYEDVYQAIAPSAVR